MSSQIIIKNKDMSKISTGSQAEAELLVHKCAEKLHKTYPYHIWHVSMSKDYSVIQIRALNIHSQYGIVLHTQIVQNDPDLKCVLLAGGELLERAFLSRTPKKYEEASQLDLGGAKSKRLNDEHISIKDLI